MRSSSASGPHNLVSHVIRVRKLVAVSVAVNPARVAPYDAAYRQLQIQILVGPERFELSTNGLKVTSSGWARPGFGMDRGVKSVARGRKTTPGSANNCSAPIQEWQGNVRELSGWGSLAPKEPSWPPPVPPR